MADAVKRSGKVLQVGTQSRSTECVTDGITRVLNDEIGDVLVAKACNNQRRGSIGNSEPTAPPAHLNFDSWVGPASMVPYRKNLLPGVWRWWHNFGCGDIGNDGVHDIDVALWGAGVSAHPNRVACFGGKYFFDDDQQFPDTQYAQIEYSPSGASGERKQLVFEQRIWTRYTQDGYKTERLSTEPKACSSWGTLSVGDCTVRGTNSLPNGPGEPTRSLSHKLLRQHPRQSDIQR